MYLYSMTILDWILLSPVLFGVVKGIWGGVVNEWSGLVGILLGIWVGREFKGPFEGWVENIFGFGAAASEGVAFALLFLATMVLVILLGKALTLAMKWVWLGWVNRLLGGVFGAVKYALIALVVLHLFVLIQTRVPIVSADVLDASTLYHPSVKASRWLVTSASGVL